jgi:hypothetical protein
MSFDILDVRSCRGADCDTDHCLVVAKVRERLTVSKQAAQTFDVYRFNLRKLYELEVRKEYQIEIRNKFAALENLNDNKDINRAWDNIKQNIKTSSKESLDLCEVMQHKPRFIEEGLEFLDQRNLAKMQWLQDQNQCNVHNLNNVRLEASTYFKNKKKEYLKAKIE